jgi:hypothetical protein
MVAGFTEAVIPGMKVDFIGVFFCNLNCTVFRTGINNDDLISNIWKKAMTF